MRLCVLLLLVLLSGGDATSSCSTSQSVALPSSISSRLKGSLKEAIGEAFGSAANVITIGHVLNAVELLSPALETVEVVIESYEQSYSSLISYIEKVENNALSPTSISSFYSILTEHSTLVSAISTLLSVESEQDRLSRFQVTLQHLMHSQSDILLYLRELTEYAYSTVYFADQAIEEATIEDPSVIGQVVELDLALADKPHVSAAIESLVEQLYKFSSYVDSQILQLVSSSSVVRPSVVSSISSRYTSVYSEVSYVDEFVKSHTSLITSLVAYLSAAIRVPNIGSAVRTFVGQDEATLEHDLSVVSSVLSSWPSLLTQVSLFDALLATSPSLNKDEHVIEISFYGSASVAAYLYSVMLSPSMVTDSSVVSSQRRSHRSFVQALDSVRDWQEEHSSLASEFAYAQHYLDEAFASERTLLTAARRVLSAVSPTRQSAEGHILSVASAVTDLSTVLSAVNQVLQYEPSLVCYEESIARYAVTSKYAVSQLWLIEYDPSSVSLAVTYEESLEARHPDLVSYIMLVESAERVYTSLASLEESLISAMAIDSTILTDWNELHTSEQSTASYR